MWPNPPKTSDLVTFTEEILNGKLHFCAFMVLNEPPELDALYVLVIKSSSVHADVRF